MLSWFRAIIWSLTEYNVHTGRMAPTMARAIPPTNAVHRTLVASRSPNPINTTEIHTMTIPSGSAANVIRPIHR